MPVTLQLYVLRQLLIALSFACGGLALVAIPGAAVSAIHKVGGASMGTLLGFLLLAMTELVPYVLPIAFLLAVVVTYGRFAADNEWTAILMTGTNPVRFLLPAFAIALGLSGVTFWLSTDVIPELRNTKHVFLKNALVRTFRTLNRGQTELTLGDFHLFSRYRDPERSTFREVLIHLPSSERGGDEQGERTVLADSASIEISGDTMEIELVNSRTVGEGREFKAGIASFFIDLDRFFEIDKEEKVKWQHVDNRELMRRIKSGEVSPGKVRRARFEWHHRNTICGTYFLFLLLGVPTGLTLRRGTQLGALAVAVAYALIYYVLSMRLTRWMGESGVIPLEVAAWSTLLAGGLLGAVLTWRALRR